MAPAKQGPRTRAQLGVPRREKSLVVLDLGVAPYRPVQQLQQRIRSFVHSTAFNGVLLLLEHPPVITLGRRSSPHDITDWTAVAHRGIPVTSSERGGLATLHCPGQLLSYPILPIPGRDLLAYVRRLEEVLLILMRSEGINASRRPAHPGLYVGGEKIASLGLRCERGVASHGTSLNVDVDLSMFDLLTCCGDPGMRHTTMSSQTGTSFDMERIKRLYAAAFADVFALPLAPMHRLAYDQVEGRLGLITDAEKEQH